MSRSLSALLLALLISPLPALSESLPAVSGLNGKLGLVGGSGDDGEAGAGGECERFRTWRDGNG